MSNATTSPGAPGGTPPPAPPRRLERRTAEGEKMIAGLAAGVADYLGVDVTLVRLAFVLLALTGPGVLLYLAGWVLVPEAPDDAPRNPRRTGPSLSGGQAVIGAILLAIGAVALLDNLFWWDADLLFPLALLGIGAVLLLRPRSDEPPAAGPPAAGPPAPPAPPAAPPSAPWSGDPGSGPADGADDAGGPWPGAAPDDEAGATSELDAPVPDVRPGGDDEVAGDEEGGRGATAMGATGVWAAPTRLDDLTGTYEPAAADPAPAPVATRRRSPLGGIVVGAGLVLLGLAWLLSAADVVDLAVGDVLAAGLVLLGVGLVVGAWWGRARWLSLLAVPLALGLAVVALVGDTSLDGEWGDRAFRPASLAELRDEYRVGAGELVLDLSALELPAGRTVEVAASVGGGSLQVVVPDDVDVVADAEVRVGVIHLPGEAQTDGVNVSERWVDLGAPGDARLDLDLEAGVGEVVVRR